MRFGGSWAGLNPGNQNYLNALWGQSAPQAVMPAAPIGAPPPSVNAPQVAAPVPQSRFRPVPPPVINRTPVSQPETQIRPKVRQVSQSRPVGQDQATMAPGGNQSVFGDPGMRAYKKGGAVTTCKMSTASKNKSQPKW
jgi:hypothetical protein